MAVIEHEAEPIPGLPGRLPPGERILWQGRPDWRHLARSAFHVRLVGAYFAILVVIGVLSGSFLGALLTLAAGLAGVGLLLGLAILFARATIYTITSRRLVIRSGVALPLCVNLPMVQVETARLNARPDGSGDIALALKPEARAGYLLLWPHVRPWRFARPEPMLRGLADVRPVADLLARALAEAVPGGRRLAVPEPGAPGVEIRGLAA
ncbi:photosynthetic complex putative assembly protein PuhB [Thermaurantiacus sp.]